MSFIHAYLANMDYMTVCNHSSISHGSSVGRAGDCNSDTAVIPRPVVRFRPVRFFVWAGKMSYWDSNRNSVVF